MRLAKRGAVHVGVARPGGARHIELLGLRMQRDDTVGPAIRNTLAACAGVVNPLVVVREVAHVGEREVINLVRSTPVGRVLKVQATVEVAVVAANANKQAKVGSGLDVRAAQRGTAQVDGVLPQIPDAARAIHQAAKRKCIATRLGNSQRRPTRCQGISAGRRALERDIRVCPAIAEQTAAGLLNARVGKSQVRKGQALDIQGLRGAIIKTGNKTADAKVVGAVTVDGHRAGNAQRINVDCGS